MQHLYNIHDDIWTLSLDSNRKRLICIEQEVLYAIEICLIVTTELFCSITEQLLSLRSHKMANGYKLFSFFVFYPSNRMHKLVRVINSLIWDIFRFYFIVQHDAAITRQHKPLIAIRLRDLRAFKNLCM
mgnify:CR=1 FL=1